MSILATTDTAVAPRRGRPRLRVVPPAAGPVTVAWFEDLVVEHGAWLRQVVRRRMANPALVDDAVQETLLRVCRSSPPAEAGDLRRWLAGIARHACADVWRAQDPRTAPLDRIDEAVVSWRVTVPGSDDHLAAVARRAHVNDALLRLPPRHRRLLEKQALFGLSYEEIADEENVSIACVTSALGRARAGFRRRYADGEARSMPAWAAAVLSRVACRLRARMARTQAALVGRAAELAAASFTLGVAAVLVAGSASSSSPSTPVADVMSSSSAASVVGHRASDQSATAVAPIRTSQADAVPTTSPPWVPPRRAVGEIATAPPTIELTPDEWTVGYSIELGAPEGTASVHAKVTLHCEGGRVMPAVCRGASAVPGAESSR